MPVRKPTFYRFEFADGYVTICRGLSAQERRIIERDHGRLTSRKKEG